MNKKSETFCVLPWMHLETRTDGRVSPCCLSQYSITKDDGRLLLLYQDGIKEAFQSKWMERLRKSLDTGVKHPNCSVCWKDEAVGQDSRRLRENRRFLKRLESEDWQKTTPNQPVFLDLKLGNLCNLKCRICGPYSSTKWSQESTDIYGEGSLPQNQGAVKTRTGDQKKVEIMTWYDSNPEFWSTIETWLEHIEEFEIFGGEPFLINRHLDILKMSVERGFSKNQSLHYNTNGSVFPEEALKNIFPHFKSVKVMFSLDGTTEQFEYQRFPAKWETSFNNLFKFKQAGLRVEVCLTLSALNIYYLPEYLEFWSKHDVPVYLNVLNTPTHYSFQIFPNDVKEKIVSKLSKMDISSYKKFVLNPILPVIESITAGDLSKSFPEFLETTFRHDKYRQQSYEKTFPEFYETLKPHIKALDTGNTA